MVNGIEVFVIPLLQSIPFFLRGICRWQAGYGCFYTRGCVMHLDELGKTFFICLWCKDGHKMHHPSRRAIYECLPKFVQTIMRPLVQKRPMSLVIKSLLFVNPELCQSLKGSSHCGGSWPFRMKLAFLQKLVVLLPSFGNWTSSQVVNIFGFTLSGWKWGLFL